LVVIANSPQMHHAARVRAAKVRMTKAPGSRGPPNGLAVFRSLTQIA
jgi:hypothetical protein